MMAPKTPTHCLLGWAIAALILAGPLSAGESIGGFNEDLTRINSDLLITTGQAQQWHAEKDKMGPTFSGSPGWHKFLTMLETKLREHGAVGITKNTWTYDRWHTTEWPDDSGWSLVSDGATVKVASYGAYSGATGPKGVTAPLLYYDPSSPPKDLDGKIVVFPVTPLDSITIQPDYEFATDEDTLGAPGARIAPSETTATHIWGQLLTCVGFIRTLRQTQAAGALFVFDSSFGQMAGLYTFPVPMPYAVPALYLDRATGAKVIEDARAGKEATLRLEATVEEAETYQLVAYLPGRDYGTEDDRMILLTTHTDGPSISQDNGALGILGIVHYFSKIPRPDRPRTLMIHLDNRHYMPGLEQAFAGHGWFETHPEAWEPVVGFIGIEHLGQLEFREVGETYSPTGRVELSSLYVTNNPQLIELAVKSASDNRYARAMVTCAGRPGKHGLAQGTWYGLGRTAQRRGLPGFATMGTMGAYWATTARIGHFDAKHFQRQVATMAQLTGELMVAPPGVLSTVTGSGIQTRLPAPIRPHP